MQFKFLRESYIFYEDKKIIIEVWKELESNKIRVIDQETRKEIDLKDAMGEEI